MLFIHPASALDPSIRISQFAHTAWHTGDGVLSGTIRAITQTADGYLWIGTGGSGVLRFDGVRFVSLNALAAEPLPAGEVVSLLAASDGSLWIGTDRGLYHWSHGHLEAVPEVQGIVTSLIEDHRSHVWATRIVVDGAEPICELMPAAVRCFPRPDGISGDSGCCNGIAEDSRGDLWVGGRSVLLRGVGDTFASVPIPHLAERAPTDGVGALAAGEDGSMWIGIHHAGAGIGLQHLTGEGFAPARLGAFDSSDLVILSLFPDRERSLWIGTDGDGLYRLTATGVSHFGVRDGLSGDLVRSIYQDREGTVWVATEGGLDSFRETAVTSFSKQEGLASNSVASVLAARDGTIWVGSDGGLDVLSAQTPRTLRRIAGLPGKQVTSLLEDHAGHLWVGVENNLWRYDHGRFTRVGRPDGRPLGILTGLTEDRDDNLWATAIGPPRTLIRIRHGEVQALLAPPEVPAARKVAADVEQGIWLGLVTSELARLRNGHLDRIPSPIAAPAHLWQLAVSTDGSVAISSTSGYLRWQDGVEHVLGMRNGLPCENVYASIEDQAQNLWLYAQCGLLEINHADLLRWWRDPQIRLAPRVLDAFDGARPGSASFQAAARSADGRLWFASNTVLQTIDPRHLVPNVIPPPVHIEATIADQKVYASVDPLRLSPLTRTLQIDYTALSLKVPQKVRFRYRLEGHDAVWQDVGTRRQAFYNDLPPGRYLFRVIACNNDGVWNETGAELGIEIAPAWFQTLWFRLLCALGVVVLGWSVYRLRMGQMAAEFNVRLEERARLSRDLHDSVLQTVQGSKMAVDNALVEADDMESMRTAMLRLSSWLEQAIQEGRAALQALRENSGSVDEFSESLRRAMRGMQQSANLQSAIAVLGEARPMNRVVREEVRFIVLEAVRNAYLHSGGAHLDVQISYEHDLRIRVSDDGKGIDPAEALAGKPAHFGLPGMRERAARLGGTLEIVSSPNSGTVVTLTVPRRRVFLRTPRWLPHWLAPSGSGRTHDSD